MNLKTDLRTGYLNSSHIDPRIFGAHHNTAAENFSLLVRLGFTVVGPLRSYLFRCRSHYNYQVSSLVVAEPRSTSHLYVRRLQPIIHGLLYSKLSHCRSRRKLPIPPLFLLVLRFGIFCTNTMISLTSYSLILYNSDTCGRWSSTRKSHPARTIHRSRSA